MQQREQPVADDHDLAKLTPIYRFLARSMSFPEASWFDAAYCDALSSLLDAVGWREEAEAIRRLGAEGVPAIESLQVEHTRLFLNAVPHVIAPPYGSPYLSDDAMLYGPSAVRTKQFYREMGFDLPGEADIPDHLVLELEFLALLAEEGRGEEEALFLRDHFRPWFPHFRARVMAAASHPFYRVLVNLIDFFTREELDNGFGSDET
jgi:TorA maturation chaperone TorD